MFSLFIRISTCCFRTKIALLCLAMIQQGRDKDRLIHTLYQKQYGRGLHIFCVAINYKFPHKTQHPDFQRSVGSSIQGLHKYDKLQLYIQYIQRYLLVSCQPCWEECLPKPSFVCSFSLELFYNTLQVNQIPKHCMPNKVLLKQNQAKSIAFSDCKPSKSVRYTTMMSIS